MARLRKKHLPHRVTITRLTGEGAEGPTWADPVPDIPAYTEGKSKLVIDRRSTSETAGAEVLAATFFVLLTTDDVLPGSKILSAAGTPRERTSEVIDSTLFNYNETTPNHVEGWAT
ncbi:hypothetical protein [Glaciihabitans sp. dw_435]|uniref:hypothetical protein n=1 Tax=Glaciihabitans sp. dw_435 TaxID=2720081 RepID=UPI001BD5C717|nr:hypothetical protein [Glaciihabitans sp. dw_435]